MPGIAGLVTKMPRAQAEPQLLAMVAALRHEPFYETGTWIDEALGIYIGWTALPGSFSSGMPLANGRGDICLVFSGEEFPDPGPAERLKRDVPGNAACSYLAALAEADPEFPLGLNGQFHGLLVNKKSGVARLFNDRYGMHRLYYYHDAGADTFYFGAESKAILAARKDLRRADPRGLGEMAAFSCVLEDRTIFQGIHALPAGSAWEFRGGRLETKRNYFHPREWEAQAPLAPEAYYEELKSVFARMVPRYFGGSEPIGMTLTGGLDTRLLLAWHKAAPGTLPCYTFGSKYRENHDVRVARQVAETIQQSHQVLAIGDEFLRQFPRYAERSVYMTEGAVDVYRTSDLYVSERARQIAPVKVVGTYGSEIVCHAVMFKPPRQAMELYGAELRSQVQAATATYGQVLRENPVTFAAFRQSPWYHHGILALEQTQLTVRSPYLDNDFVRTIYRAPVPTGNEEDVRWRLIREGSPALAAIPTDRAIGGSAMLQKLREFSFKAEYAYDYGMPQWVSRTDHFLAPLRLQRLFLGRHKLLHFRVWYRDELAGFVQEMLLDPRTLSRPYVERKNVEAIVRGHLHEGRNYTTEIHKLLTLELVHRLFFDSQ